MESIVDLLRYDPGQLPASAENLRQDVRDFLAVEMKQYSALTRAYTWDGADQTFSEKKRKVFVFFGRYYSSSLSTSLHILWM